MNWKGRVEYSESCKSGLVWLVPPKNAKQGELVGYIRTSKRGVHRWQTMIKQKSYLCHRIVWELFNGEIPDGMIIDHIDQNPLNNKIENLRCVTNQINLRNKGKYLNSSTGITGVCIWTCPRNNDVYATAQWQGIEGNRRAKRFQVKKYGEELAVFIATEYRLHQIDLLNLMDAGYTSRHGT